MRTIKLLLILCLIATPCFGAGLDANTKLYLSFDQNTLGATTVDGAYEVLDCGSGANVITQVGTAAYQTAVTKVWNASVDFDGDSDAIEFDGLLTDLASATSGTIAFWVYPDADGGAWSTVFCLTNDGTPSTDAFIDINFRFDSTDYIQIRQYSNEALAWEWKSDAEYLDALVGTFFHIMVSHNGTTPTIYIDGADVTTTSGSFTDSTNLTVWFKDAITDTGSVDNIDFGRFISNSSPIRYFNGKISDARISTTAWTSGNATTLYGGGSGTTAAIGDEVFWIQDVQDQSGDGGSGSYHIPDFIATAQLDTGQKVSSGSYTDTTSLLLDGNSDYVTVPDSADWDFYGSVSQDYTLDFWVKFADHAGNEFLAMQWQGANDFWQLQHFGDPGGSEGFYYDSRAGGTSRIDVGPVGSVTDTNWHHIALINKTDGVNQEVGLYLDGTQIGYGTTTTVVNIAGTLEVGRKGDGTNYFQGNIAHLRIQASNIFSASPNATPDDTIVVPTAPYSAAAVGTAAQCIVCTMS